MNLIWLRRRAAWGLWFEAIVRAVAPAIGVLAAYLTLALFGFASVWVFAATLMLMALCLGFGIARLRRPAPQAIDRRIEQVSGLRHRPIAMLEDEPENDSDMAAAIWQLHRRRIAASLQSAKAGRPAIGAVTHDPFALRGFLLLLLLVAAIIAGPDGVPRLLGAFALPAWPFAGPGVSAWITLPGYTGAPPLVLSPGDQPVVLTGSQLTLAINGVRRLPRASFGPQAIGFSGSAQDGFRATATLTGSARLRIGPWWDRLAGWNITVLPPAAPVVQLTNLLPAGHALLIGWHARDRYGLVSLTATLMPLGHPNAIPELLSLPLNGQTLKDADGIARPDVSDSPYAGLEVSVLLTAGNLAGISGAARPMTVRLPLAPLQDKTAMALSRLRQLLALQPAAPNLAEALTQLAQAPPSQISAGSDLQMAFLARQMANGKISADAAQDRMAKLARQIEEGPDYEPAQALAAANQALEQALQQGINGKPLDNARLQSLLAEMHAALARHLQALGPAAADPGGKMVNAGDLDRMAERIAQDEAAGRTAKAAGELSRLQQMLAALQSARPMSAAQAKRAEAADQAAENLSQMMQGEAALLDQTNQGKGLPASQAQLQGELSSTSQNLAKAGIEVPGLGDAGNAMGQARDALAQQDTGTAINAEGSAIEALQRAAAALAAAGQGMSFGEGSSPAAAENDGEGLSGAPDENSFPGILPLGDDAAGAIQRQIIKDDDDPALPSTVHQYYRRLLDQDSP